MQATPAADPATLPLAALRQRYQGDRAAILASIGHWEGTARGIHAPLRRLARLADEVLRQLWRQAALPPGCTLVAVGGYGRGELFPHSDIDVLLLLPEALDLEAQPAVKVALEGFIGACWDVGLTDRKSVV